MSRSRSLPYFATYRSYHQEGPVLIGIVLSFGSTYRVTSVDVTVAVVVATSRVECRNVREPGRPSKSWVDDKSMFDYYWWYQKVLVSSQSIKRYELMYEKNLERAKKRVPCVTWSYTWMIHGTGSCRTIYLNLAQSRPENLCTQHFGMGRTRLWYYSVRGSAGLTPVEGCHGILMGKSNYVLTPQINLIIASSWLERPCRSLDPTDWSVSQSSQDFHFTVYFGMSVSRMDRRFWHPPWFAEWFRLSRNE